MALASSYFWKIFFSAATCEILEFNRNLKFWNLNQSVINLHQRFQWGHSQPRISPPRALRFIRGWFSSSPGLRLYILIRLGISDLQIGLRELGSGRLGSRRFWSRNPDFANTSKNSEFSKFLLTQRRTRARSHIWDVLRHGEQGPRGATGRRDIQNLLMAVRWNSVWFRPESIIIMTARARKFYNSKKFCRPPEKSTWPCSAWLSEYSDPLAVKTD